MISKDNLSSYDTPVTGSIYYGPVQNRPTTAAQVKLLTVAANNVPTLTLPTGLNGTFIIALPPGVLLSSVYDNTAREDVTANYAGFTMPIDGWARMCTTGL
jgi:hypothetical protein